MSASSSCVFDCQQGFFTLLPAPASSSSLQERSRGLMFDGNPWAPFSWELSGFPGIEMTLLVCFYFLYSKMTMRKDQGVKFPVSRMAWTLRNLCTARDCNESSCRTMPLSFPGAGWDMQIAQHTPTWKC